MPLKLCNYEELRIKRIRNQELNFLLCLHSNVFHQYSSRLWKSHQSQGKLFFNATKLCAPETLTCVSSNVSQYRTKYKEEKIKKKKAKHGPSDHRLCKITNILALCSSRWRFMRRMPMLILVSTQGWQQIIITEKHEETKWKSGEQLFVRSSLSLWLFSYFTLNVFSR